MLNQLCQEDRIKIIDFYLEMKRRKEDWDSNVFEAHTGFNAGKLKKLKRIKAIKPDRISGPKRWNFTEYASNIIERYIETHKNWRD